MRTQTSVITLCLFRCVLDISVQAIKEDHIWEDEEAPSVRVVIPGPPNPPKLCCTSVKPDEFILEWGEPRLYGGAGVRGYQVHIKLLKKYYQD